jgi:hypothetical protein
VLAGARHVVGIVGDLDPGAAVAGSGRREGSRNGARSFGASEAGQVLAVMVNSLASAPTTVMLAILKTSVPGFDRVVVSAPLVVPIFWLPNEGDRADEQPMQVVSGAIHAPRVHFEAPPSSAMPQEMRGFINWFNRTAPGSGDPLPNLTRAGIAHPISSPFIPSRTGTAALPGRLPKKRWHKAGVSRRSSLRRRLSSPGASSINEALEAANKHTEITAWLRWFAATAIEAQRRTIARVEFLIDKTRLLDRLRGQLNDRQEKVLLRMLREGPEGFKGGLSAGKYSGITGASPATTTRDLTDLVAKGALIRVGERRHARYHIAIPLRPASPVVIGL